MINLICALLVADFVSGIFHWWEDRYGNPDWPILGKYVVEPNIRHHQHPMLFCEGNYFVRNWTALIPSLIISVIFYYYGYYFWCLVFIFLSQSNEIHCWEHTKTNRFIRFLQDCNILQDKKTHSLHHKRPYDTNYCVMTMFVNPILNATHFWYWLETVVYLVLRVKPRPERKVY
jgi:ubiquitin-conjugating enzyme E2 variant